MSNLINRLNAFGSDDPFEIAHICQEAAARIETLEKALRDIVEAGDFWEMDSIARKALAEGQDAP